MSYKTENCTENVLENGFDLLQKAIENNHEDTKTKTEEQKVSQRNAFKIIFEKGVRLTRSIKTELNDLGCHFSTFHKGYIGPIKNKSIANSLLEEKKVNASFQEIADDSVNKPKQIRGMESRIDKLDEEVYESEMLLLADVYKYDINASTSDFSSPPSKEGKSDSQVSIEDDFHRRFVSIKEKRKEIENLRNSLKLHKEEGEQGYEILESLSKNEIGDAEIFVNLFKDKYVFDPTEGKEGSFYLWNGSSWQIDLHKERYKDFEDVSLSYANALETIKFGESIGENLEKRISQLRTHRRRKAVLETVSAYISFKGKWDCLPNKLPCVNGIIDLKTGSLEKSSPDQFIKKTCQTVYDPNATCPKFEQFLKDITLGDKELERFIARLLGYSILGIPKEEKIFYFYGNGRNGKGTLMHVIQHVLGPLSKTFPSEMLLIQRNPPSSSSPNPEMANLEGVRIAVFSEINEGRKVDSAKIKNLSGRDTIPCRRLFSNTDLQITPTHTMILQTNYKPKAPADDKALWSRNVLIPFNARFVKRPKEKSEELLINENLKDELVKEEAPGILRWLVEGCIEYQSKGLQIPQSILDETESYRKENDCIAQFIEQACNLSPELSTRCQAMETAIKEFCTEERLTPPTRNEISAYLKERFHKEETKSGNLWKGVGIKPKNESDEN